MVNCSNILSENEISAIIVDSAVKVHSQLGAGLLESCYEVCLAYELIKAGLKVESQKLLPIYYDGQVIDSGFRIDILVENKVVIELKSVEKFNDIHTAQTLTYLKLGKFHLGLLLNFNVQLMKFGIKRIVNHL